jgi:hypothetical protein
MIVVRNSPFTGETRERDLPITQEQLDAWLRGALIQDAFPQLSASAREFILTGMTDEEWDELFGDEPEDEDDEIPF